MIELLESVGKNQVGVIAEADHAIALLDTPCVWRQWDRDAVRTSASAAGVYVATAATTVVATTPATITSTSGAASTETSTHSDAAGRAIN